MGLSAEAARLLYQIKEGSEELARLGRNGGISVSHLRELYAAEGDDYDVQQFLAGYADTPSRILEDLAGRCESPSILALLAENIRTPKPILQQLARHDRVEVRKAVASGRGISPQVALLLCDDPDASVRAVLAENPSVTPRVQIRLSEDPVPFVRAALLKVGKLDEEIQLALCDDIDIAVQLKALLSPRIGGESLLRQADGDDGLAQRMLLMRSQLPEPVLESLLFSKNEEIRREAVNRKTLTDDEMVGLARGRDEAIREKLALMPGVPALIQGILAEDPSLAVRKALASSPELADEALERLLEQNNPELDVILAENAKVPVTVLGTFADRTGGELLRHAACRPNVSDSDAAYLAEHGDDTVLYALACGGTVLKNTDSAVLRRLSCHASPSVREMVARSSGLTIALMADLAKDPCAAVRLALALNSEMLSSLLQPLTEDHDSRVVKAALATLAAQPQDVPTDGPEDTSVSENEGMEGSSEEHVDEEHAEEAPPQRGGIFKRFIARLGRSGKVHDGREDTEN